MDIITIYRDYLMNEDAKRERNENVFHASSAGSCFRKQMYSYYNYPSSQKDDKSLRLLRLGTLVHADLESALTMYKEQVESDNHKIHIEEKVKIEDLDVVGTFDAGETIINDSNIEFNLYDYKTAAAYKWTTKFGRKQNRVAGSDTNYKLQLGTYALAVKNIYEPSKLNMYLIWYNKNTSQMREQIVSNEWIDSAFEYWVSLNEMKNDMEKEFEDELTPGISFGVPVQDWECRYCQYYDICPSNLADKKNKY